MSYIGQRPDALGVSSTAYDHFSGDGVTSLFFLSRNVTANSDIQVVVNNVIQDPGVAYYVYNLNNLQFIGTPSIGANNISVVYRQFVQTGIAPGANTVTQGAIADSSISSTKLQSNLIFTGTTTATNVATSKLYSSNITATNITSSLVTSTTVTVPGNITAGNLTVTGTTTLSTFATSVAVPTINVQTINAGSGNTITIGANNSTAAIVAANGTIVTYNGVISGNTTISSSGAIAMGNNAGLTLNGNSDLVVNRADGYGTFSIVTPAGQGIAIQKIGGGPFGNFSVNSSNGIGLSNSGTSVVTNPGSLPGSTSIGYMITQTGGESVSTEPLNYTISSISVPPGVWVIRAVVQIIDASGTFNGQSMAMAITTNSSYGFSIATNSGFTPDHALLYTPFSSWRTSPYRGRVHNSRVISNTTGSNVTYYIIVATDGTSGGTWGIKSYTEMVKVY